MIAKLLILIARGWQLGPVADIAANLPLQPKLFAIRDYRAPQAWRN